MSKQTINIGSAPNDNTGDLLRDAFDKVNQNFTEVYSDHTISDKLTVGNTVANSTANSTAVRVSNSSGTATLSAANLTIGATVIGNNSITTTDVTVSGNLYVLGTTTSVNTTTLEVADRNITLAKNATTPTLANGAGITIAGASATFNYYDTTNNFNLSHSLAVGNVSTKFVKLNDKTPDSGSGYGGTNDLIPAGKPATEITDYTNTTLFSTTGMYSSRANTSLYLYSNYNADVIGEVVFEASANYDGSNNFTDGSVTNYAQYADSANGIYSNYSLILDESSAAVTWNFANGANGSTIEFDITENTPLLSLSTSNGTVNHNTFISAQTITIDSTLIANSTGPYGKAEGSLNVNSALIANNSSYLGGVAAANYVQNTDSRTLSGNLTFSGANTIINGYTTANTVLATKFQTGTDVTINSYAIMFGDYVGSANSTLINRDMTYVLHYESGAPTWGQLTHYSLDIGKTSGGRAYKVYIDRSNTSITLTANVNQLDPTDYEGKFFANTNYVSLGNSSVNVSINSTSFSGTANNSDNLGGVAAASYVQNTDSRVLSGNLNFTGANVVYDTGLKVGANVIVTTSTITVGNSTVNTVTNATSFTGTANNSDNLGGVAAASYVQNTDSRVLSGNLNFTGANNVYDTGFKVGANVVATTTTITVGNATINTVANATSYAVGAISATTNGAVITDSSITVGNTTVNTSINATAFSGIANNANNLGGVAAASYVQNTDSRTLSGNIVFSGANTTISSNTLNLGTSTVAANGYTYLPNGLKMAFGSVAANSTVGDATYASAFTAVYSITITPITAGLTFNATTNTTVATIRTSRATTAATVYYMAIGI